MDSAPNSPHAANHGNPAPPPTAQLQMMPPYRHNIEPPPITFTDSLDLAFIPVEDIPQRLHPGLKYIDLTGNKLHTCPHLTNLPQLETICLRQNYIVSLAGELPGADEPLRDTSLVSLDAYDNQIENTDGIQHLRNLTYLDLSFNKIRKIEGLENLGRIQELYLIQNKISEIANIGHLQDLTLLEFGSNRIRKIENLEPFSKLQKLFLGRNKITKLEGLSTLSSLRCLSIQFNRLTAIEGLEDLVNLEELYLSNNGLTTLTGLYALSKLKILDVANNFIETTSGVEGLQSLTDFWCNGNRISHLKDLQSLQLLPHLETVYFEHTPLQRTQPDYRISVLSMLPNLIQVDADEISDREKAIVKSLVPK